jgi:tetratricopeptide (TPR) repeat protein
MALTAFRFSRSGLSFPVILLSGVIAAIFLCIATLAVNHVLKTWSPTKKNIDRLIMKRRYNDALSLMKTRGSALHDSSDVLVLMGKIWLAVAWERMNLDRWKSYGKNEEDWFDLPEASTAEKFFLQALEHGQANADAHYFLGILYMEKGWYAAAEIEFLEALKVRPDDIRTKQNLGVLYSKMDRPDEAARELLGAHDLDPENTSIMKNLCFLYRYYLDKPDSGMLWANRYLNMHPEDDLDMNAVREEFRTMSERYPELMPDEPLMWQKPRRFKSLYRTPSESAGKAADTPQPAPQ